MRIASTSLGVRRIFVIWWNLNQKHWRYGINLDAGAWKCLNIESYGRLVSPVLSCNGGPLIFSEGLIVVIDVMVANGVGRCSVV